MTGVPTDPALLRLRERLDRLNRDILELVQERGEVVLEVAALKEAADLDCYDPRREAEMLRALTARSNGPFLDEDVTAVFQALFAVSLRLQRRRRAVAADQPEAEERRPRHLKALSK
ncbi:MAG TPA: chorismate mutase [Thermoanaerobaculia bacterium]|jgi:3-deoxy-7-phosphoheptulonate synthase/chorismate mutase|nr:chorismate mutase [Thermoanaerobaculia bacterium]